MHTNCCTQQFQCKKCVYDCGQQLVWNKYCKDQTWSRPKLGLGLAQ